MTYLGSKKRIKTDRESDYGYIKFKESKSSATACLVDVVKGISSCNLLYLLEKRPIPSLILVNNSLS